MASDEKREIYIDMSNPCGEKWDNMNINSQGRFCEKCRHSIIDFTNKSDSFIFDTYSQSDSKICGMFSNEQLGRKYYQHKPFYAIRGRHYLMAAAVICLSFGPGLDTSARSGSRSNQFSTHGIFPLKPGNDHTDKTENDSIIVKGQVLREDNKRYMADVYVHLKNNASIHTYTDAYGNYALKIPTNILKKDSILIFKYPNWRKAKTVIKPNEEIIVLDINLVRKRHFWPNAQENPASKNRKWRVIGCLDNFGGQR